MPAILRPAQPTDGQAVARIQLAAWQATYGELNPAMVAGLDLARTAANWTRAAEDPQHRLRLAEYAGIPVGYAFSGPAEDGTDGVGELHAVYVLPTAHGSGIGRLLVQDAVSELAHDGYIGCVAWVVEQNAHARGFYEHVGFRADGARDDWRGLPVVRYRTATSATPAAPIRRP